MGPRPSTRKCISVRSVRSRWPLACPGKPAGPTDRPPHLCLCGVFCLCTCGGKIPCPLCHPTLTLAWIQSCKAMTMSCRCVLNKITSAFSYIMDNTLNNLILSWVPHHSKPYLITQIISPLATSNYSTPSPVIKVDLFWPSVSNLAASSVQSRPN